MFRFTTWGESHGPAIGVVVDGCPPKIPLEISMFQHWMARRRPGRSKFTSQRREADDVEVLSGVFEGKTTGTPIQLLIKNTDQRSRDYSEIEGKFRPGHADLAYLQKYGIRITGEAEDPRRVRQPPGSQPVASQGRLWRNWLPV